MWPRLLHLVGKTRIAERKPDFGFGQRKRDLFGAQQRHGRNHDGARLDDREIRRHHHRTVRPAQQHPVSRHDAEIAGQHVGDAIHPRRKIGIGPALGRRDETIAAAMARGHPIVDERGDAVQPIGIVQLRQLEQKLR